MPRTKVSEDEAIERAAQAIDSAMSKINTAIHYLKIADVSGTGRLQNTVMDLEVFHSQLKSLLEE